MTDDTAARGRAVDPRFNVALEASAGTGKTRVLVDRYINLLKAGVDPSNILAMTFTRKAAAEMRERIMAALAAAAARGDIPPSRWRELRDRTADITISTIDAFCLSLLREFPLEADLDPGFTIADDTELPRLIDEALDRALRICRAAARDDENVALAFAQLGERRARSGLATLLRRRIVAPGILSKFLASSGDTALTVESATARAAGALIEVLESMRGGGLQRFLDCGPLEPGFQLLKCGLVQLCEAQARGASLDAGAAQALFSRARDHFLTQDGRPRARSPYPRAAFASEADWRAHTDLVVGHADAVLRMSNAHRRDLNVLVSRGIWRMYRIADAEYRRTLDAHALLDFPDLLLRALDLLRRMDDFAQSRYRLESRYHHVLVDEFQDTSRAQWELVSLLVQSWGEGAGLAHSGPLQPSIFIVGDRKQSIYGFRDADVSVLREAARHLERLRPDGDVRRTISRSFRASPPLLAFINDVCDEIDKAAARADAFDYGDTDRFPVDPPSPLRGAGEAGGPWHGERSAIGIVTADTPEACASATAAEIARLLEDGAIVRDRETGIARPVRPGDIGILFRTRDSHREFEAALERLDIRSHVYKGLGFFDADEIKDVLSLVWYLADPVSDLRAASLLRSRVFGLSDEGLRLLAPHIADAVSGPVVPHAAARLAAQDARALADARDACRRWLHLVDRLPAAELVDLTLIESAYAFELRGRRYQQARENLKKMRSLMRRIQNRGYGTLARMAAHLDQLAVGDEANAAIDAFDAVSLMTVHAAKGLEFPVVFVVNLARGSGNRRDPVRLTADPSGQGGSVAVGDFQSDADEDHAAREREETKRLLYVALTRARDRLYLGSVLKDGVIAPGRGSLAEVLPASLLARFSAPAGQAEWAGASGRVHQVAVRRTAGEPDAPPRAASVSPAGPPPPEGAAPGDDLAPLQGDDRAPATVASLMGGTPHRGAAVAAESRSSDRLVGTLVHRMLERRGFEVAQGSSAGTADDAAHTMRDLMRPEEIEAIGAERPVNEIASRAAAAYNLICRRPDIRMLYSAGRRWHEVPFTMRVDGVPLRGTIDCLVQTAPGRISVLEFKTGRQQPAHHVQLDLYTRAARRLFPGAVVEGHLIYAGAACPAEEAPA